MGKNKKKLKESKGDDENIIADPRFSSVHWDPRFQNVPKHKAKVEIDSRFNRMFTDKRFSYRRRRWTSEASRRSSMRETRCGSTTGWRTTTTEIRSSPKRKTKIRQN
ncbi:hypothetical protein C1H46_033461 [Malus baccata]|uniref:NUC153 domain-containing protein n=1 Tax=Malus baccata TaxID=106549 RepID=A0A540L3C2_MALBA|nr:hypothetical protein C1H46_033461 [Malus baccata]